MTKKLDFLGECNNQGVPLEDFRLAFCARCFQQDCTRSQFGTSKFEARVTTWEERLFKAPQLQKTDPRFPLISAKRFLSLNSGPAPSIREWIDPQTLDVSPPAVQVPPAPVGISVPVAPVVIKEEPLPEPEKAPQVVTKEPVKEPPLEPPKPNLLVETPLVSAEKPRLNTPYAGPRTLAKDGSAGRDENQPAKDAWAAPSPVKPGERVVKPGAKVKIGGRS
jgi:hypothetical protein